MALDFINSNPADDAYGPSLDRANKQGKLRQDIGVDTAIRGGVSDMLGAKQPDQSALSNYQSPAAAAPLPTPPPVPTSSQPRGIRNNNPLNIEDGSFSSSQPGYAGTDGRFARFHTPEHGMAAGDALLQSYGQQGLSTPTAIISKWAPSADGNNVQSYAGQIAASMGIGPDDQLDMANAETRGKLAQAMSHVENGVQRSAPPGVPPNGPSGAPSYQVPRASFMPGASAQPPFMGGTGAGTRFDPILSRLAQQPGGGTEAMKLLQTQGKFDQQNYQRQTQASKLAMTALARGDVQTAKYWASYAGIPTDGNPAFEPGNNGQLFGQVGLLSQRLYGPHTPEATNFASSYFKAIQQNGGNRADAFQKAFDATGPAPNNPKMSLKTVIDSAGDLHLIAVNTSAGTATPVTQNGAPVVGAQPTRGGAGPTTELTWVRQADGTEVGYTRSKRDGSLTPAVDPGTNQQITKAARTPAASLSFDHKVDLFQKSGVPYPEAVAAASGQRPQYQIVQANDGTFSVVNKGTAAATPVTAGGAPVTGKLPAQTNEIFRVPQADGSELGFTHNRQTNTIAPAINPGTNQQFSYAAKPNAATSTFDHKVQLWQQMLPNDPAGALAAASGHIPPSVTPGVVAGMYKSSAASIDATTSPGDKEDQNAFAQRKQALVQARMNDLFGGPGWQNIVNAQPRAPAAAPSQAPAARPVAPAPVQARIPTGASAQDAIPVRDPSEVAKMAPGTWFVPEDGIPRKTRGGAANVP